ncbi:MAG: 2'-5' RNA ligase family protein [Gemmatimonadota bacterium]|nr:2'-5' RNA ligase family protein [Gemmatimonadota bacterium]
MIKYVDDTSKWENWQRDYRLGVILILPPPDVSREIDILRVRYDPRSAAWCPAHITLSDPLSSEMSPSLAGEIRGVLSNVGPFKLHYDKLYASKRHAGVAYRITPREPVERLKDLLHGTSGFAGETHRRRDIAPHMTIAEFISIEESLRLCARLQDTAPAGFFLCDRLTYMVPDDGFRFQRRSTFPLGDSAQKS